MPQERDIPAAISHLALVGASIFTGQGMYYSENPNLRWTYAALGIWSIVGLLGSYIHGLKDPPETLKKLYNDLQFIRPCLDLPLALADLYTLKGVSDIRSMTHVIAGLVPVAAHITKLEDVAQISRKFLVPAGLASALTVMGMDKNWLGGAAVATYGVNEYGIDYSVPKVTENPPIDLGGMRALGLSAFSLMFDKMCPNKKP